MNDAKCWFNLHVRFKEFFTKTGSGARVPARRRNGSGKVALRGPSSHVPVAVLALALTDVTVDSLKASALFDLLAPPLHMARLGVVLP